MNLFVADPHWGWWIVFYFYLGGMAAGLYFLAAFLGWFGREEDRPLIRVAHLLCFPLISICGILLIVDLNRPERFWHMVLQSEVVEEALATGWPLSGEGWQHMLQAPMLKTWSPMSIGAWAVLLFSLFSFLSFLGALRPGGKLAWLFSRSMFGKLLQVLGAGVGFFVASYTGVLLTATNQPLWSDSEWIGALFLTSAASTGVAVLLLTSRWRKKSSEESAERLERMEFLTLLLEFAVFMVFLASLNASLFWSFSSTVYGLLLLSVVPLLGILLPLALHLWIRERKQRLLWGAASTLAGGFLLRLAILGIPPVLLSNQGPVSTSSDGTAGLLLSWGLNPLAPLLLLAMLVCLVLFRHLARTTYRRVLLGIYFFATISLMVVCSQTTPEQRQQGWDMIPLTLSPEEDRPRGGGEGASSQNRPAKLLPRSKVFGKE